MAAKLRMGSKSDPKKTTLSRLRSVSWVSVHFLDKQTKRTCVFWTSTQSAPARGQGSALAANCIARPPAAISSPLTTVGNARQVKRSQSQRSSGYLPP